MYKLAAQLVELDTIQANERSSVNTGCVGHDVTQQESKGDKTRPS